MPPSKETIETYNQNKKKNIAAIIASTFLFLALFDGLPYGYFTLLRFVVFTLSSYIAWMAYQEKKEKWIWIFGSVATLFNPFIVIYLNREMWIVIDLIAGILMIVSVWALKLGRK